MRYIKDLLVERAILHVSDANADEPLIASKLLPINEDVESFIRKHIIKSLKSDDTFSAKFLGTNTIAYKFVNKVINNTDLFNLFAQGLATKMFNVIKNTDIPSTDMLFVQYVANEQRCFAILALDHREIYTHNVNFSDDEMNINLITQESELPGTQSTLKKCAFFTRNIDDEIEMIVINKKQAVDESNADYFVDKFLEAVIINDDTNKTRKFKPTIEKWTQRNLSDNIGDATIIREILNDNLLNSNEIDIPELLVEMFGEESESSKETIESLKSSLEDAGYTDKPFEIDKDYIAKTMLTKQLKTDTGFVLKGDFDLFKDSHKFEMKDNGNGTCDYIIKNVRNVNQK